MTGPYEHYSVFALRISIIVTFFTWRIHSLPITTPLLAGLLTGVLGRLSRDFTFLVGGHGGRSGLQSRPETQA